MVFYIIIAVALGVLNVFNKMVNVKASEYLGNTNGTLINYFEATLISLFILLVTGDVNEITLDYIKNVPFYLYLGSIAGLIALIFLVIGTKKSTVMISTVVVLIGQLSMSIVLDCIFFQEEFSIVKVIGIFLVISGMTFREKIIKKLGLAFHFFVIFVPYWFSCYHPVQEIKGNRVKIPDSPAAVSFITRSGQYSCHCLQYVRREGVRREASQKTCQ